MRIPEELSAAIAKETRGIAPAELARASAELSGAYRGQTKRRPALGRLHRCAYLVTRFPATYVVVSRILREAKLRVPDLRLVSMLDLGSGPGTTMWAAAANFPELEQIVAVEDSAEWIALGRNLAAQAQSPAIRATDWVQASVADSISIPPGTFDLVMISYVVNELGPTERVSLLESAWKRTGKLLVVAEPGTPAGFAHIREIRHELLAAGAHIVAPCPHALECPIKGDDWCHFAERLQRTSEHRLVKGGELGYEDEKYSYVVFARQPIQLPTARILRHPRKHSGHVELKLCTPGGLQQVTVSRKQGDRYKAAKRTEWGETFE